MFKMISPSLCSQFCTSRKTVKRSSVCQRWE